VNTTVPQVAAQPHELDRLRCRQRAQKSSEVLQIERKVGALRAAAGAPGRVPVHRLVEPQLAGQARLREVAGVGHVHGYRDRKA